MDTTATPARFAHRAGQGGRDRQLDDLYPKQRRISAQVAGQRLFVVADGFGDDDHAAEVAIDALAALDDAAPGPDPLAALDDAVARAAEAIAARPGETGGTTLTALLLLADRVLIAHVGDSRAYLVRDGSLERLTRDHTVVQSLVDAGRLTPEEAATAPDRTLLNRALGHDAPWAPDLAVRVLEPGDRLVLTTDGVHGVLEPQHFADLALAPTDPDTVAGTLETAVLAAGAPDNYGLVVVDV